MKLMNTKFTTKIFYKNKNITHIKVECTIDTSLLGFINVWGYDKNGKKFEILLNKDEVSGIQRIEDGVDNEIFKTYSNEVDG